MVPIYYMNAIYPYIGGVGKSVESKTDAGQYVIVDCSGTEALFEEDLQGYLAECEC